MTRGAIVTALALLVPLSGSAQTAEDCQPQPDCRIAFSPLKPGAPRSPLNSRERVESGLRSGDAHIYDAPSNSFRIPSAPMNQGR